MTTGTQLDELQILRGFLQERLQLELPHSAPFEVQCVIKNGELIILAQHPPGCTPDLLEVFGVLKQAIPPQQPEIPHQVKLYLRMAGQNRPYAFDKFTIESSERQQEASSTTLLESATSGSRSSEREVNEILSPPPLMFSPSRVSPTIDSEPTEISSPEVPPRRGEGREERLLKDDWGEHPDNQITDSKIPDSQQPIRDRLENPFNWTQVDETDSGSTGTGPTSVDSQGPKTADLRELLQEPLLASQTTDEPDLTTNPWDQSIPNSSSQPDDVPKYTLAKNTSRTETNSTPDSGQPTHNTKRFQLSRPPMLVLVAGTGIAAMFFFCTLYVLTRPCVLGSSCAQIAAAGQLNAKAEQTLQRPNSGKEILEAQQQLRSAIDMLETIPYWSSHYQEAQNLMTDYQAQVKLVDDVVKALKEGAMASVKSQNPPHSPSEWLEIQKRWREAALHLEQVPKNSKVYNLAQQKQKAYKANLVVANKRFIFEQQAKQFLNAAQESAKKAEVRQGVAQSLESWYLVYATWQMAVNRLEEIPQGTTAYEQAQELLPEYQNKLVAVRDRTTVEQFAANAYKQSLSFAQQAKNFQAINQWSQAVVHWSYAVTSLKQIPRGTYYYSKTNNGINAYTEALKQAQAQLQLATLMQQARSDLNQTCAGKPQICNFTITSHLIKVRLTTDYMQQVRNTALSAKARNDYNAQAGVVKHVLTLGEALEAISDNARIRLEVYTPDGALRQAHNPA